MEERSREKLIAASGKSFEQWVAIAKKQKLATMLALRAWLKQEHGLGSRYCWWIASAATTPDAPDCDEPESLVDKLYSGSKAAWRDLHEALVDEFLKLGKDVLVTSCKTMVPIYRKYVFAELKPMARGVQLRWASGAGSGNDRLDQSKSAAETWASCTAAMQRDMLEWIASAQREVTRSKRIATALDKLKAGQRRVY